jgi:hypothetical protein
MSGGRPKERSGGAFRAVEAKMAKTNPISDLGDFDGDDEWGGPRTIRRFSLMVAEAKMAKTNPISDLGDFDGSRDEWGGPRTIRSFTLAVVDAKKAKTNPISDLGDCGENDQG